MKRQFARIIIPGISIPRGIKSAGRSWCSLFILLPVLLFGQKAGETPLKLTDNIVSARKTSESLARSYTWNCRTEITRDGKVLDIVLDAAKYSPDGKIQYTVLNDQGAKLPSMFLIRQIAEDEKNKLINFLHGMKGFLEQYSLPAEAGIIEFIKKAKVDLIESEKQILLTGETVVEAGDRLLWWVDEKTFSTSRISVSSVFEGEEIQFNATFRTLGNGLNYMAYAEAMIPKKNLVLQLQNFDYIRIE